RGGESLVRAAQRDRGGVARLPRGVVAQDALQARLDADRGELAQRERRGEPHLGRGILQGLAEGGHGDAVADASEGQRRGGAQVGGLVDAQHDAGQLGDGRHVARQGGGLNGGQALLRRALAQAALERVRRRARVEGVLQSLVAGDEGGQGIDGVAEQMLGDGEGGLGARKHGGRQRGGGRRQHGGQENIGQHVGQYLVPAGLFSAKSLRPVQGREYSGPFSRFQEGAARPRPLPSFSSARSCRRRA